MNAEGYPRYSMLIYWLRYCVQHFTLIMEISWSYTLFGGWDRGDTTLLQCLYGNVHSMCTSSGNARWNLICKKGDLPDWRFPESEACPCRASRACCWQRCHSVALPSTLWQSVALRQPPWSPSPPDHLLTHCNTTYKGGLFRSFPIKHLFREFDRCSMTHSSILD